MAHGHRRHVKGPALAVRSVVTWGVIGLGAGFGLLVAFGVPWSKALLGTGGLLIILLVAYLIERSGVMRLPNLEAPARPDDPPQSASDGLPWDPPTP